MAPLGIMSTSQIIIPRPFKLRLEYDAAIGKKSATYLTAQDAVYINYGLHSMTEAQRQDPSFDCVGYWEGMIFVPDNVGNQEIYTFKIKIPTNYPTAPPIIRFVTKAPLSFIDSHGYVNVSNIPGYTWSPHHNIANVLVAIRARMDSHFKEAAKKVLGQVYFSPDEKNVEKNFV